jgi:hypothetical protein
VATSRTSNFENFAVSRFKNRTGTTSWRVNGWLHGLRIRRNFKTREEAAAQKSVYEIKALQAASGLHPVARARRASRLSQPALS